MEGPPSFRPRTQLLSRILLWLWSQIALASILVLCAQKGLLDTPQDLALTALTPSINRLRELGDWAGDWARALWRRPSLVEENEALRREVERLKAQLAAQTDARERLQELELVLDLRSRLENQIVAAKVIASHQTPHSKVISIDKGEEDGLREGMTVLTPQGSLLGRVKQVLPHHSWVLLITDPRSAVNVAVQTSPQDSTMGIVLGQAQGLPTIDMVPQDTPIERGQLVVTSGLGGRFPPGILVGTVKAVERRPQDVFAKAWLEPAAQMNNLHTVAVLVSFIPPDLSRPP